MYRIRLSRALLAALAVAALASGGALLTSDTAHAPPASTPASAAGTPRIDPGIGRGPTRVDPGFGKNSGPTFTVKQVGHYGLSSNCHWIRNPKLALSERRHPRQDQGLLLIAPLYRAS